jgi:hypothetical protein
LFINQQLRTGSIDAVHSQPSEHEFKIILMDAGQVRAQYIFAPAVPLVGWIVFFAPWWEAPVCQ